MSGALIANEASTRLFHKKVDELVTLGKPRIAFGLQEPNSEIIFSLDRARCYADIILVGPPKIGELAGYEKIMDDRPEEKIAELLASDCVDGIIRGTLDDVKTREAYANATRSAENPNGERYTISPALFETPTGRQFFMGPVSNSHGWTKEERYNEGKGISEFVREWGVTPLIAVYCGVREKTYEDTKDQRVGIVGVLNSTYEDADWIVKRLNTEGFKARNVEVDIDVALENGFNVHIPVNGMVGNQIFRMLTACGGKILAATLLGLSRLYEDNTRNETDYEFHVKWLTALINKRRLNSRGSHP